MKYAKFSDDFLSYFRLDDNGETLVLTDKQGFTRAVKLLPYEERPQGKWIEYKLRNDIVVEIENNEIIFLPKTSQEYAQSLFDEWVAYAEDCLHKNKWNYLSFPIWLGGPKKLTDAEIEQVLDLVSSH